MRKDIHCVCSNEVIIDNLDAYLTYQGFQIELVNPMNYTPADVLIVAEPYIIKYNSFSIHRIWRRYLYYHSPETKLLVCGYSAKKHSITSLPHANYINLINPPKDLSIFIENAKKVSDYKLERNQEPIKIGEINRSYNDLWDTTEIPIKGVDFIESRYNIFFEGHNLYSSLVHQLPKIKIPLNNLYNKVIEDRINNQGMVDTISATQDKWIKFVNRWHRYKQTYFDKLPFFNLISQLDNKIHELHRFYLKPPNTIEALKELSPHLLIDKIIDLLDNMMRYSDHRFGDNLEIYITNKKINSNKEKVKRLVKRKYTPFILIAEDRDDDYEVFYNAFSEFYNIHRVNNPRKLFERLKSNSFPYDLIMLDLDLRGNKNYLEGLKNIKKVKEITNIPIIVWTHDNTFSTGIDTMEAGAKYYFRKLDFDFRNWIVTFEDAIKTFREIRELRIENKSVKNKNKSLRIQNESLKTQNENLEIQVVPFISRSQQMKKIKRLLRSLAKRPNIRVLLYGETGVGKEVAAKYYHYHSLRHKKNFLTINLAETPKEMLPDRLFGHKKGAFSGATSDEPGIFTKANKGVLFLDEIGEMSHDMQLKLLRVVEYGDVMPLGSTDTHKVDIQLITATNKDLKRKIENNEFRNDLFERLNGYYIEIPPLRERREDILPIMLHLLGGISETELSRYMDKDVVDFLINYPWERNVRQLKNVVGKLEINRDLEELDKITFDCIPKELLEVANKIKSGYSNKSTNSVAEGNHPSNTSLTIEEQKAGLELMEIEKALTETYGRKKDAAKKLGMNDQNLRFLVLKLAQKHPSLINNYPKILEKYKRNIKEIEDARDFIKNLSEQLEINTNIIEITSNLNMTKIELFDKLKLIQSKYRLLFETNNLIIEFYVKNNSQKRY